VEIFHKHPGNRHSWACAAPLFKKYGLPGKHPARKNGRTGCRVSWAALRNCDSRIFPHVSGFLTVMTFFPKQQQIAVQASFLRQTGLNLTADKKAVPCIGWMLRSYLPFWSVGNGESGVCRCGIRKNGR
jgi:hypothetical protein